MKILVATDFSAIAVEAMRVAADYARRFGAKLHVLHVTWPDVGSDTAARLERLAAEAAPDVERVLAVRIGVPAREIVDYASRHHVDLVVVGTHGRTGVSRTLTGSIAERVVRTAPCPVLTVPAARPHAEPEPAQPAPHHCIVCARESEDLVCEGCRARIRGEALTKKREAESAGRAP